MKLKKVFEITCDSTTALIHRELSVNFPRFLCYILATKMLQHQKWLKMTRKCNK
nr:MAG TPA: hypothetical protein [Caudoviricetes sp.]